ncbi:MAG: hypothetical protein WAL47_20930, partial [Pyrinomonadaceae bacterium]
PGAIATGPGQISFELCEVKKAKDPILVFDPVAIARGSDLSTHNKSRYIAEACETAKTADFFVQSP